MKEPKYWWDFVDSATAIHVKSDIAEYPVLARIEIHGSYGMPQIKMAEALVANLAAGRITPERCIEIYRYGADRI